MQVTLKQSGDFKKAFSFFERIKEVAHLSELDHYGRIGVEALSAATPKDTGETANSWYYDIDRSIQGRVSLNFYNSNIENGVPIAVILQYGHGTGTGGWVEGIDYINPAVKPVFEQIVADAWKEVTHT